MDTITSEQNSFLFSSRCEWSNSIFFLNENRFLILYYVYFLFLLIREAVVMEHGSEQYIGY